MLKEYFEQFGRVDKAFIIYHHKSGESRGFGFVEFVEKKSVSHVLQHKHDLWLDDSQLDCESAVLKGENFEGVSVRF